MSKLRDLDLEFLHGVPVHLNEEMVRQIKALLLELIREDDSYSNMCHECDDWDDGRNALRAELRKKINNL